MNHYEIITILRAYACYSLTIKPIIWKIIIQITCKSKVTVIIPSIMAKCFTNRMIRTFVDMHDTNFYIKTNMKFNIFSNGLIL